MRSFKPAALALFFSVCLVQIAAAATLSFGSLSTAGNTYAAVGASVSQSGFTVASADSSLYAWEASSGNLPGLNTANTSLFEFFAGGTDTVTDGGSAFSATSIDLAPVLAGGSGTFTITFTGTHAHSTTVTQSFTVNDGTPTELQTFDFTNFTNLVSLSFSQGTNIGFFGTQDTAYQFDNLVVTPAAVSAAPEPTAIWLAVAGLIAVVGRNVNAQSGKEIWNSNAPQVWQSRLGGRA
jgi:hypothetical protein